MLTFPLRGSGSGVYTDKLSEFLIERGHQVKVLCCDHYRPNRTYPVEVILFNNGANDAFDLYFNFPAFTTHPASRETTFGTLSDDQKRAYQRVFRARITQEMALFQPDIVHVHHGWVIGSIVAELNVPYVISLHGTEHLGFEKYPRYRTLALQGLRGARLVVAHTAEDRERAILMYALAPQKVVVVQSGIDTDVFKPLQLSQAHKKRLLQSYAIDEFNRPVVFFGGKLTAIKGVDVLLRAACIYSQIDERPVTLIAGAGDTREDLERLAGELGLDRVYFLGHQSHEQMVRLYNVADIVAIPSSVESFPLVAMEALACGTPIVASDVGSIRQILGDNEQIGHLVPPGDPIALADKISASIQGRFKAKARRAAVAHIRQNLSWENTVSGIEHVYERCFANA
jgi:glycosyltransferase involved in cell wall biosynthesis